MKKFIFRVFVFSSLVAAFLSMNYSVNRYYISHEFPNLKNIDILIAGDSHLMTSINPELLENSQNIAQGAEPYIVTYHKLKLLLEKNKNIDTVILGFSYQNLSAYNDRKFYDKYWAKAQFEQIYPIMTIEELEDLPVDTKTYYRTLVHNLLLFPRQDHYNNYIGGFLKFEFAYVDKIKVDTIINRHYYYGEKQLGPSKVARLYLDKIVSLSEENGFNLILVNTPLHQKYLERIPQQHQEHYFAIKRGYERRGITVLDYGDFPFEDRYFYDYDHLNYEGSLIFTELIRNEIDKIKLLKS